MAAFDQAHYNQAIKDFEESHQVFEPKSYLVNELINDIVAHRCLSY